MSKLNSNSDGRISIQGDYFFESVFVFFLLMMGLLSGYLGGNTFWVIGLLCFITILLINKSKYRQEVLGSLLFTPSFYAVVILGCASIVLGFSNQYLTFNLKWWLYVLLVLFGIIILDSNKKYDFRSVLKSHFYLLNFFWIANLIIVTIQCTGNGFMIKQEWLANNWYYQDHCAGLFGANGTHRLSIFTTFMSVYNLDLAKNISSNSRRRGMYIYIIATDAWMLYVSTLNDNKTLFMLLPAWLLMYYIIYATNETIAKNLKRIAKFIPIILLLVIAMVTTLNTVPLVTSFVQDYVLESAKKLTTLGRSGKTGSIERITIAINAIKSGYGLLVGKGLGAAAVSESLSGNYLGYSHFSMSSIGTMTTLGGVWFYLSVCLFYTHFFYRFIKLQKKSVARWLFCLLIIMALTVYTPIFDAPISMLWTCLTFAILGNKNAPLLHKVIEGK